MANTNPPLSHTQSPVTGLEHPLDTSIIGGHTLGTENADAQKTKPQIEVSSTGKAVPDYWDAAVIDPIRWNQKFPYQLMLVEVNEDGGYSLFGDSKDWLFTLPIPPESMTISMPFAINVSATLGGIVEEHNGAPFKMISISGTTGIFPSKGSMEAGSSFNQSLATGGILGGIVQSGLTGVVSGVDQTIGAAQSTVRQATDSNVGLMNNVIRDSEVRDPLIGVKSGYYQFLLLQSFFERYAKFKKTNEGRNKVLAFANWKDTRDRAYLVTPLSFDLRRTAASPYEYAYTIQLKAWRRVSLAPPGADKIKDLSAYQNPDKLASVLATITSARRVLQSARTTLKAVSRDIDRGLNTVRETTLFLKDLSGLTTAVSDLPDSLKKDMIKVGGAFSELRDEVFDRKTIKDQKNMKQLGGELKARRGAVSPNQGPQDSHPGSEIYRNPSRHQPALENVNLSQLDLPVSVRRKIEEEKNRVRNLTRLDFEKRRNDMVTVMESFADSVGAGSSTYDSIFGRESIESVRTTPTEQDLEVLFALNESVMAFNALAVSSDGEPSSHLSTIEYIAGLARGAGIAFVEPVSKFAVPFPYGSTLEMLSNRYLGDPNRWHEIATINGLREPYVDEVGFRLPLLTNGNGNQVVVSDVSNVFVGQPVYLSSKGVPKERRRVIGIRALGVGQNIVSVDGEKDLEKYKVLENGVLEAFLPDTVNSQMLIYIPSPDVPIQNDFKSRSIPGINEFDPMIAVGGVDFLLTPDNDIVLTEDGDSKLAVGLTNIVQRIRLILNTRRGTLLQHPEYGLPIEVGMSVADTSAANLLKMTQEAFSNDPTFSSVKSTSVSIKGGLAQIGIAVEVTGVVQPIPVSFEIKQ